MGKCCRIHWVNDPLYTQPRRWALNSGRQSMANSCHEGELARWRVSLARACWNQKYRLNKANVAGLVPRTELTASAGSNKVETTVGAPGRRAFLFLPKAALRSR